jgi:hypothetical protein
VAAAQPAPARVPEPTLIIDDVLPEPRGAEEISLDIAPPRGNSSGPGAAAAVRAAPAPRPAPAPAPAPAPLADGGEAQLRQALSKASREVIERIAWEVVPQLAETIIRQELDRLIKEREGR